MARTLRPRRLRHWLALAMVLACTEEDPDAEEPSCDGELGRFEYPEFEPPPDPDGEPAARTPCILRGGRFAVEFVAHAPVVGDASVRAASPDFLVLQDDGRWQAEQAGEVAMLAWADARVLDVVLLQVLPIDVVVTRVDDEAPISDVRLRPQELLRLAVRPVLEARSVTDCVGELELTVGTSDPAVVEASIDGTEVELVALARGEARIDIELAGIEYVVMVVVSEAERDDTGGSSEG
jgi:hypothetical protein